MPGGGVLTIETAAVDIGKDSGGNDAGISPGIYALLTVSDRGQGMKRDTLERIFEPFFTTKPVGQGTGLGLSIVYGIVTQHSGTIHVRSEWGTGTLFSIYLPIIETIIPKKSVSTLERRHVAEGTETILIAEDDMMVRKYMSMILKEHGYKVLEAADGEEALRIFETKKDAIDLLLLDVVMPRVNGKAVFDNAIQLKPGIKALFMSGYTADIIHKKGLREEGVHFISKPVVQQELMEKIRELLGQ